MSVLKIGSQVRIIDNNDFVSESRFSHERDDWFVHGMVPEANALGIVENICEDADNNETFYFIRIKHNDGREVKLPYSADSIELVEEVAEKKKKLITKEDYLEKMLEGVKLLLDVKQSNIKENETIDAYVNSLFEQMQSEEEDKKQEENKKKMKEELDKIMREEAAKKAKELAKPIKKPASAPSSTLSPFEKAKSLAEEMEKATGRPLSGAMGKLIKALDAQKAEAMEQESAGGVREGELEKKEGLPTVTPFLGGDSTSRNREVRKDKEARLHAKPKV